jgi:hypothetical protein
MNKRNVVLCINITGEYSVIKYNTYGRYKNVHMQNHIRLKLTIAPLNLHIMVVSTYNR